VDSLKNNWTDSYMRRHPPGSWYLTLDPRIMQVEAASILSIREMECGLLSTVPKNVNLLEYRPLYRRRSLYKPGSERFWTYWCQPLVLIASLDLKVSHKSDSASPMKRRSHRHQVLSGSALLWMHFRTKGGPSLSCCSESYVSSLLDEGCKWYRGTFKAKYK